MTELGENLEYTDKSIGYEALSNPRRRYIIRLLDDAETSLTLRDLATEIVRQEQDQSDQPIDEEQVESVRLLLYHSHVPKLADAGFVRYNKDQERVSLSELAPLTFIDRIEE